MLILEIQNEDPITLRGYIDATGAFQLAHTHGTLPDHSQTLHAAHERSSSITIELHDFDGWRLSADHDEPWTRGQDCVYHAFAEAMTEPLEVTVTASNGGQAQTRNIYIKTKPMGSLPAR